jgi:L-ascorbate metabolism protein UlaG (beta-lactamase superfamily)
MHDTISVKPEKFIIHVLGHSSVFIEYDSLNLYIDPYNTIYNFTGMPKANLIFVTHGHADHFDITAIDKIKQTSTLMVYPQVCAGTNKYTGNDTVLINGDSINIKGIGIKAVPAYNLTKTQHPKGVGNGYVINIGNKKLYFAGDTEKVPEMSNLKNIDFAFVGYSQPYNMTADSILSFCKLVKPKFLVPYHYDNNDPTALVNLMKTYPETTVLTDQASIPDGLISTETVSVIRIYPNPVKELLYINTDEAGTFNIFDINGKTQIEGIISNEKSVLVDALHEGNYLFKITNKGKEKVAKFIKKNH